MALSDPSGATASTAPTTPAAPAAAPAAPQPPPVRQPDHVGIRVQDMEAAVRFYQDVLGLPVFERTTLGNGIELVFLKMGSTGYVELIGQPGLSPAQPVPTGQAGLQHFCLQVDDLDAWIEYLAARNVPLALQPLTFDLPSARCRRLYITDPDGTPVELFERTPR